MMAQQQSYITLEKTEHDAWLLILSIIAFIALFPFILAQVFYLTPPHPLQKKISPPPTTHTVSSKSSTPKQLSPTLTSGTHIITVQHGDTLGHLFKRLHLSAQNLQQVIQKPPQSKILARLKPQQTITFTIQKGQLQKLIFPYSTLETLVVTKIANHYQGMISQQKTTLQKKIIIAKINGSLYKTAKKQHIPPILVQQIISIFNKDIDFKRGIKTGDEVAILYEAHYFNQKQIRIGDILAVRYINQGQIHEAIQFKHAQGKKDYYTPRGVSLKKAFDRYPLRFSHIASPFSLSRYHPILHYRRPHYGVDLAAPLGTPVHATGDGHIEKIGRNHGYGNMIKIHHNATYSTIYAHLSRFQKGLYKGKQVKRGDVIGYVGQSGLASGPHCHFEFHVHAQPKNPLTLQLPYTDPISKKEMPLFQRYTHQLLASLPPVSSSTYLAKKHISLRRA